MTDLRRDYAQRTLSEADLDPDPVLQFRRWLDDAVSAGLDEPNAMVLATADDEGRPAQRTVLLRGADDRGFLFFSNRMSRKGVHLAANPTCALLFPWYALERQVEVVGRAEAVSDEESDAYFASRPRGSQLASAASAQSTVVADRAELERRVAQLEEARGSDPVPRPAHWGGTVVVPRSVELWQGRPNRLHDRLRYSRTTAGAWIVERLSP